MPNPPANLPSNVVYTGKEGGKSLCPCVVLKTNQYTKKVEDVVGYTWNGHGKCVTANGALGNYSILIKGKVPGKLVKDYALEFKEDAINAGTHQRLNLTRNMTIETWVKYNSGFNIVGKANRMRSNLRAFTFYVHAGQGGKLSYTTWDNSGKQYLLISNTKVIPGQWHHLAATFDGRTMKIYYDGRLVGTKDIGKSITLMAAQGEPFKIGGFNGLMDELRVWNIAKSAAEIKKLSTQKLKGDERGLVLYYNFNHSPGSKQVTDQSISRSVGILGWKKEYNSCWKLSDRPGAVQPPPPITSAVLSATYTTINPKEQSNLKIAISGGKAPYKITYKEGNNTRTHNNYQSGSFITVRPSQTTVYSLVSIEDVAGNKFSKAIGTIQINVSSISKVVMSASPTIISKGKSSELKFDITGGKPPFTIVYKEGNTNKTVTNYKSGAVISVQPSQTTIYSLVSVKDANGSESSKKSTTVKVTKISTSNTNYALNFDGSDDYIDIEGSEQLNLKNDWTLEFWLELPSDAYNSRSGRQGILDKYAPSGSGGYTVFYTSRDKTIYLTYRKQDDKHAFISKVIPSAGWHHIAITFKNNVATMYVDGVAAKPVPLEGNFKPNTSKLCLSMDQLAVSGPGGYNFFKGKLDELRIWNTAKTTSDIQRLMYQILQGNESDLILYYNFNHPPGSPIVANLKSSTRHGYLKNMNNKAAFVTSDRPTKASSSSQVNNQNSSSGPPVVNQFSRIGSDNPVCRNSFTYLKATINGGTPPFKLIYTDGNSAPKTINNYKSNDPIKVNLLTSSEFRLLEVTGANGKKANSRGKTVVVRTVSIPGISDVKWTPQLLVNGPPKVYELKLQLNGGRLPAEITYMENGQLQQPIIFPNRKIIKSVLKSTTYTLVKVADSNGCFVEPQGIKITLPR